MRWAIPILCLLLSACLSPVITDSKSGTDFRRYHSYAFVAQQQDSPRGLDDQRAEQALKQALAAKGLQPASADQADLLVRHFFKREQRFDGSVVQFGFGFSRDSLGFAATTPVEGETIEQYKLVVQLVDRVSQQVVWQATSRDRLDDEMSRERRIRHIQQAVSDMFTLYPPAS
ncbi:MAG: DUF4136 domain-containing protein [Alcanivorax sp.]|nr:DUF4136 domain-containing protein [Alcanivorax sp.]